MLPKMDEQRGQQLLQQQPDIQKQGQHPPQSPTTPSWSIADKIVKDELSDEKNDDSGVSPGHYTSNSASPRSRRSSSVMNCSLSPGSSISDSQSMQCTPYDYSPSSYKLDNSPLTFGRINSIDEDTLGMKNDHQEVDGPSTSKQQLFCNYQCPLCIFTTTNRLTFTQHLMVHYTPSDNSGYDRAIMEQDGRISPTMSGDRSEYEYEDFEDINVPRINSQGKVKTHKCRQCSYVSITKLDFWQHNRRHIKIDKLLTCPKCPFVTEYKHHLEYHLRNHFGSKPFKCTKCPYSCVNKSMLNSHLKSHSNVYQYRCANCSYATKYCHSLKLHLRKYNHQPAMVLNADGSPNPLPIIDVYGTRRGPKPKPVKTKEESQYSVQNQLNNNLLSTISPPIVASQMMMPTSMPPMGTAMNMSVLNSGSNGMNNLVPNHANVLNALSSYNQLLAAGYPMPNSIFNENIAENALKLQAYFEYTRSMNNEKILEDSLLKSISTGTIPLNNISCPEKKDMDSIVEKCESVPENCYIDKKYESSKEEEHFVQQQNVNNLKKTGTSRRKGKAVKLDKHILEKDSDEEQDYETSYNKPASTMPNNSDSKDKSENADQFACQYCEISFGNDVMYTVHMGYHGYQNPFTCNMCGHQCSDKVSFFLHIAKSKH
ncbi:protein hunchback [Leptopilina boulardi]|uniref:protein hunchback n=1 Tax=Leptopilina boulardi TaxID=63433 RepID=UPI0021F601BD|nr:protein hunchback [Leptopilina boulardi]XP_051156225.1 protein hunchback [Leptopilina boulardi]